MTAYWLIKSEPDVWSWDDQMKAGKKGTHWDGVRNNQAAIHLRNMAKGDPCFFYHSGDERQIVGLVEVTRGAYPDPSDETGRYVMVDVRAREAMKRPVPLAAIKADPKLQHLQLVRISRLSVSDVDEASARILLKMGGLAG